ncbi:hypothetical protein Misp01_80990 [Microtetraspora sp. NBRC 13810]|nr:hypothetical protein Misp01_80990 [Microtetraspora sp. NBRC 13810]
MEARHDVGEAVRAGLGFGEGRTSAVRPCHAEWVEADVALIGAAGDLFDLRLQDSVRGPGHTGHRV